MDTFVLQQIIEYLPFEQQMKLRVVDRQWNNTIMEPYGDLLKQPININRVFKKAFLKHHMKLALFFTDTKACCHTHRDSPYLCESDPDPDHHVIRKNLGWGLKYSCQGGHHDLVDLMFSKNVTGYDFGLAGACRGGHRDLVDLMLSKGATDYSYGLWSACRGGHRDLVELMVSKGTICYDIGLWGACRGGHRDLVELMSSKGAIYYHLGLFGACRGGHRDLVELMLTKGAKGYNDGLGGACRGGYPDLVKLMISKGADYCGFCRKSISEHLSI
jgi:hypothetical protein